MIQGSPEKIGWDSKETPGKRGELRKKPVNTGKTGRASGKSGEAKEKSGVSFTTPEKGEELQKKLVNAGRRRSSGTTPRKCGVLPEKLVKSEKTPEKDGETPVESPFYCKFSLKSRFVLYFHNKKTSRI